MTRTVIDAFESEFSRYRRLAERAAEQLAWEQVRAPLDPEINSVAVIMKHLGGNLRSRWTEALTTDGEKPWRDRDGEFVDDFADRDAMMAAWNAGWAAIEGALAGFSDADLARTLLIRTEPHTLVQALARSLSHTAYHGGQIVQASRIIVSRAGGPWRTLTIARGGSAEYNQKMGVEAKPPPG